MKYVSDTHSLFWFQTDDPRLSKKAREIFERGEYIIIIPSIVLLELMRILEKKKANNFKEILNKLRKSYNYPVFPLDFEIIEKASEIRGIKELHDKVIVATAKVANCDIITRDKEIIESKEIECVC